MVYLMVFDGFLDYLMTEVDTILREDLIAV